MYSWCKLYCRSRRSHYRPYLLVLAEEARTPPTLAARPRVDPLPAGQDLVAGGGVIAPCQLGTAGHVRVQNFSGVLHRK